MSELLEKILSRDNMNAAYRKVCANKGAGGIDEVTVEELGDYIKENFQDGDTESLIRKYLKAGVMTPQGYEETKQGTPQGGLCRYPHNPPCPLRRALIQNLPLDDRPSGLA